MSRRQFLKRWLVNGVQLGATLGVAEAGIKGLDLLQQHDTWVDASKPNSEFLSRHASQLSGLEIGGSFAPEEWSLDASGRQESLAALEIAHKELRLQKVRLGLRWSRSVDKSGTIDIEAYRPYLDYCLLNDIAICLNVGPIRTFRWPEEHVPQTVLEGLAELPGDYIRAEQPLARMAQDYTHKLVGYLGRDYGADAFPIIQIENEPYYPLGKHAWLMGQDYLTSIAQIVLQWFPNASLLVTSAGRLNLDSISNLFAGMVAVRPELSGRLVSGFDFHYRTPRRDSIPIVRYFDQLSYARPFAPSLAAHRMDAKDIGFSLEVTEGQAEPYGHLQQPGNSATDFRYLLLRCLDEVFEPSAAKLLRIWGVEALTKKMLHGELTGEHRQIIELIQVLNTAAQSEAGPVASSP